VINFILLKVSFGCTLKSEDFGCLSLILLNNPKDKYYYIEILSKVIERLKKNKFYEKLKNASEHFDVDKILKENNNKFSEKINKKKEIIYLKKFENKKEYDFKSIRENAHFFISLLRYSLGYITCSDKNPPINAYKTLFEDIKKFVEIKGKDESKSLIKYLIDLKDIYETIEFQKRLIYFFNFEVNKEKINNLRGKQMGLNEFNELNTELSENSVFYIFEESKPNVYEKFSLITNKYKEEILSVDMFESIKKTENKHIITRYICKSIFTERKIIIERFNLNYESSIDDIENELQEEIQFLLKQEYSYKDLLFQIENKLYRCPESYDVFIKEIMKMILFIIINRKNKNEKIKIDNSVNEEIKEALKQIVEKEKKIKDLESKISRYPFDINEGEKLMSIIIKSEDNNICVPIISKNSYKFTKIEEEIYEMFNEYSEKENYFTLKGNKINRNKTLEENGIKDKDIIIMKNN
jgi:hypothetical protein